MTGTEIGDLLLPDTTIFQLPELLFDLLSKGSTDRTNQYMDELMSRQLKQC